MTSLADRLKEERESKKLTQAELARRVGVKKRQSLISNIESGLYQSSPYLPEIAYALGVQAMWLKTGLGPKPIYPGDADTAGRFLPIDNGASHTTTLKVQEPNSLEAELADHVASMSERGMILLIDQAQQIAAKYPKVQPKVA